jgi:hypothetical protein
MMKCMSDQSDDLMRRPLSDDQRDHLERRALERARRRLSDGEIPETIADSEWAYADDFKKDSEHLPKMPLGSTTEVPEDADTEYKQKKDSRVVEDRDAQIICPHCQMSGSVSTYEQKVEEEGLSTWSVLAAPLTYGLSLLWGWKSSKYGTFASCSSCGVSWRIK